MIISIIHCRHLKTLPVWLLALNIIEIESHHRLVSGLSPTNGSPKTMSRSERPKQQHHTSHGLINVTCQLPPAFPLLTNQISSLGITNQPNSVSSPMDEEETASRNSARTYFDHYCSQVGPCDSLSLSLLTTM